MGFSLNGNLEVKDARLFELLGGLSIFSDFSLNRVSGYIHCFSNAFC